MTILEVCSVSSILACLLSIKYLFEGEWLVRNTGTLIELAHEFDPMETHGMQEDLEAVHHEKDSHDGKHVAEADDEEEDGGGSHAHCRRCSELSEANLDEHFTELTVGK